MAFVPAAATLSIAAGLVGAAHLGPGVGKLAAGIAAGCTAWFQVLPVKTVDTGLVGAGTGTIPLIVPAPLLQGGLAAGFAGMQILGPMAPLTILGLSVGITTAFAQANVVTSHPGVGQGTCVVSFGTSTAVGPMIAGFASFGLVTPGSVKMATAIGIGLDTTFASFTTVSPIVGAPGSSAASGVGFGAVI